MEKVTLSEQLIMIKLKKSEAAFLRSEVVGIEKEKDRSWRDDEDGEPKYDFDVTIYCKNSQSYNIKCDSQLEMDTLYTELLSKLFPYQPQHPQS